MRGARVVTYFPFTLVEEILGASATPIEENRLPDFLAGLCLRGPLLDKASEGGNTGAGPDHDDGLGGIRWELEVRVPYVNRNMDAVVFVTRAVDSVCEAVRIGIRITVLFLLECEEIIRRNALENVFGARHADLFDDSGDGNFGLLGQRRRRDRIISWLETVEAFDENGEGSKGPFIVRIDSFQNLRDIEVLE